MPWHAAVLVAKAYRRWQEGEWLPFVLGRCTHWVKCQACSVIVAGWLDGTPPPMRPPGASSRVSGTTLDPLQYHQHASNIFRDSNREGHMEPATMGKVFVTAKIENLLDVENHERGLLPADQVRSLEGTDALVDTGTTGLLMPKRLIAQLGLRHYRTRQAQGIGGSVSMPLYSVARLTINGRECALDGGEIDDSFPVLIGQIPLGMLDWVVDTKNQRLIGNPAHGGEHIIEAF